ncbi:MAG: hypothetical protein PWP31_214 [Clostridia bacterium]|nr:hypothetical protein [Clostridia bacterium]
MKIIYHCFGGSHSSVTAAAIHLGLLPTNRLPTAAELLTLPYFDARSRGEEGEIKYMGTDTYNNKVFAAGKKNLGNRFEALIYDLMDVIGVSRDQVLLLNTSPFVNPLMAFGGFTSRRLGLTLIGRPIVSLGTQLAFFKLVDYVNRNKFLWEGVNN